MLNRLTIYLAQSKAGSNLKEKIRNQATIVIFVQKEKHLFKTWKQFL